MHCSVTWHSLNAHCNIKQFFYLRIVIAATSQIGTKFQRFLDCHIMLHRNKLCNRIYCRIRNFKHPSDISDCTSCRHCTERNYLCNMIFAVFTHNIVDNLSPAFLTKIDIKIGHTDSFGIEKSFKKKIVLYRIDCGYAYAVGTK